MSETSDCCPMESAINKSVKLKLFRICFMYCSVCSGDLCGIKHDDSISENGLIRLG
ncbi:hypothetical protein A2U01_0056248, partial [Trifolium medium]|nr:hypothetical protein [Trifolium medium]